MGEVGVKLVFLGRLEDVAGGREMSVAAGALADVLAALTPALAEAVQAPRVRLALNGVLVGGQGLVLAPGDELAFLPPVSGG